MDTKANIQNGHLEEDAVTSAMSKTTTISTIAVQSGNTRIVIALLHCGDWINLKILEITPELTTLGNTRAETLELQKAHNEVLRQLQNKQSPVEELLHQADQLIATQKPRAEVYAAMAESLGRAWKDINYNLELRKQILDLNVQYHTNAQEFFEKGQILEISCKDTVVPIEIEAVKNFLTLIHDQRRAVLESLMGALQAGNSLLAKLKELGAEGTLDSRPDRIRSSVNRAISQVQGWLDELHLRRQVLEANFTKRKTQLEQCLALAILAADLRELEDNVNDRRNLLAHSNQLGDSSSSAELLLHEHKKLLPEAKVLQERALKITKATEQLVASGCYAGEQATAQSYVVLSTTSDYLADLQTRDALLERVIAFFRTAQSVLNKLDQLYIQLTATELPKMSPQLVQLHAQCSRAIEEATSAPITEGYSILDVAGRGSSGTEGVRRMVEELENKKITIDGLCVAHKEENIRINTLLNNFLEKHNIIYSWLVTIAEAFLQGHQDMGSNLPMSQDFLDLHSQLLTDLQIKGTEINTLLLTLPPILEYLEDDQRKEVDLKVEELHGRWLKLKNILENRMDLAKIYVQFHAEADTVNKEMDKLEAILNENKDNVDDATMNRIQEKFESLIPLYQSAKNTGITFINQASQVSEPHLDTKRASRCVESVLERLAGRQLVVTKNWHVFNTELVEKRELLVRLEHTMAESSKTITWVTKLKNELYPVITTSSTKPADVADHIEGKLVTVLPDIKNAQSEVDQKLKSMEALFQATSTPDESNLNIKNKLQDLSQKLAEFYSEYQILLQVLIGYFKNLEEIDKKAEALNNALEKSGYPKDAAAVASIITEYESNRDTIVERFRFAQTECDQICQRIRKQEPEVPAEQDINKLQHVLELRRAEFENQWRQRHDSLESHRRVCVFDGDLRQINTCIEDLDRQVKNVKGQYGESVASAKSNAQHFSNLENTIQTLEHRIQSFIKTGEMLITEQHIQSPHIQNQLTDLQDRWNNVKNQTKTMRYLVDLSIPYFQLIEEAEDWFREGNKLLVTIARKSTAVKQPSEAVQLLNEIHTFLKPGEEKQNHRISQISEMAQQLYGSEQSKPTSLFSVNRDMLDSFTSVITELTTLEDNLKSAELEQLRKAREQELARLAEETRKLEEARLEEERRKVEDARRAEEERLALERRRAEEARLNEEARLAQERIRAEELRLAEERRKVEEAKLAEESRQAEERRKAEHTKHLEELKLAEERLKLEEEKRKLEEARLIEEVRKAEEVRMAEIRRQEEQAKISEWRRAEEERLEIERRNAEEQARKANEERRIAEEERRKAEEANRLAEQKRKEQEHLLELRKAEEEELLKTIKAKEALLEEERKKAEQARILEEQRRKQVLLEEERRLAEQAVMMEQQKRAAELLEEERRKVEHVRLMEEQRRAAVLEEERRKAEEAKILEEQRKAEDARRKADDERRKLEDQRKQFEEDKRNIEDERKRIDDERKKAEEDRRKIEEDRKRVDEERKKAEEERKQAEDLRLAEERKKADEILVQDQHISKQSVEITEITDLHKIEMIHSDMRVPSPLPIIEDAMEEPHFAAPLSDAVIQEGSKFTFICHVTGYPTPTVTWYKAGIPIQNNPDYCTTFDKGICSLTIEETFAEDSARYTCRAVNGAGEAETTALLSVKETEPEEVLLPPRFVKSLQPSVAKEGTTFQFDCKVEGNPLPTVQWFKNGDCIDNSSDYAITYNNGDAILKFEKVFLEDKADYTCKATNQLGTAQSTANLIVTPLEPTELPKFVLPLSNVMARAGQKIKLECEVSGLPLPTLTWSHNGKTAKETRELKVQQEDNRATLIIYEAFPKDAGTYSVSAKNIVGETTSSCSVSVKGRLPTETSDSEMASDMEPVKPSIQLPLANTTVPEGNRVRLDCVIVGQPEPEVIWYHDDRPVKESPDFQLLFQGDRCSLVIQEALAEDGGEYKVVALNSAGEASSKCMLSIIPASETNTEPKPKEETVEIVGTPPKFTKLLADVLVSEGDKVVLEGTVTGEPKPELKWLLNNLPVTDTEHFRVTHDEEGNFKLEIENVKPDDKGVYTVKAANASGEAKCFSQLIVKSSKPTETVKYEENKLAPEFKESFHDRIAFEETNSKFECIVVGKPTPKIKWLFNGEPISGKDFLISTSGDRQVLSIPNLKKEHSGTITCVAENEIGKASCAAMLVVQSPSSITLPAFQTPIQPPLQVPFQVPIISSIAPLKTERLQHVETSYFTNREVLTQSSSTQSSKIISSSVGKPEPHVEEHKVVSQKEQTFKQINQDAPEIKESHRLEEFHKVGKEPPVIHEESSTTYTIGEKKDTSSQILSIDEQIAKKSIPKIRPPKFITPVIGKIVDQDVDVVLEGILDGQPTPNITWTKNGEELKQSDRLKISWAHNRTAVELKNVTVDDAGRYTCTAVNDGGTAVSTADLVIRKTIFPPVFGRRLQAQVIKKGDRIIMEVEVTGTPEPTVTWHKDGIAVEECLKDAAKIKSSGPCHSLIIEKADLSHTGRYMVRAVNPGGEAQSIADIAVYEPTPDTMVEVVKTVVFEDVRKHETLTSAADKISSSITTPTSIQVDYPKVQVPLSAVASECSKTLKSEFETKTDVQTSKEYQTFKLEHKMPDIPMPKPIETRGLVPLSQPFDSNVVETVEEKHAEEAHEGIETSSISKQSSLQYFVKKIQGDDSTLPKEMVIPEPIKAEIFEKFEIKEQELKIPPPVPPKPDHEIKSDKFESFSETLIQPLPSTQTITEFDLQPEPPAEICYAPRQGPIKKHEEVSERIKKLSECQKDLSPHEVPTGAVRIFPVAPKPTVESKKEMFERKEQSFQQSSYESYQSSSYQSVKGGLEPVSLERPASVASSTYSSEKYYSGRPLSALSGSMEPSQEALQMEKQWAHKFEKQPPWSGQSTLEKKWTPIETRSEMISKETKIISNDLPKQHYIAKVSDLGSTVDHQMTYSKTESQISEDRNVRPSQIIKSWPPTSTETPVKSFQSIDSLSIRPVSVQDITDEVYLEPGPPPQMGYAQPPKERKQAYVEVPPPKEWITPPPLPPKQVTPQAPPIPAKSIRHVEPPKSAPIPPFQRFADLDPFPFKSGPEKPRAPKVGPPPTPSKFFKGRYTDSDYESDFESTKISAKWKPSMSDTEEPTYRRVQPPQPVHYSRSRSTEPEPLPPSRFEQPATMTGSIKPDMHFDDYNQKSFQGKKFTKHTRAQEFNKTVPVSAPIYSQLQRKPDSPKAKHKMFVDGYLADTEYKEEKTEYRQFSKSSEKFESHTLPRMAKFPVKKQQELVATPIITGQSSKQIYESHDRHVTMESIPKINKGPPTASPSTFVKGEFKESAYESDYEGRVPPPFWRGEDRQYKPVKPVLTTNQQHQQYQSTGYSTMIERPKFEPIEKFNAEQKTSQTSFVYKPKPIPGAPVTDIVLIKPGTPPEMGYSPDPKKTQYYRSTVSAPYTNAIQHETSNIVHFNESTENCHRTMSVQQTHKVIKFGDQFKQKEEKRSTSVPPSPTPSRFVPGEFRESDYESDSAKIKSKWSPTGRDTDGLQFRSVRAPTHTRSSSVPAPRERVVTPMEFDTQPPIMPSQTTVVDVTDGTTSFRKFGQTPTNQVLRRAQSFEPALQPGTPPEYAYATDNRLTTSTATKIASQHMDSMTQAFKSKTQKFVTDIMDDVSKQTVHKPILKKAKDGDAQVYREDTRAAQYGTKHVDPDTGLIYFKYDFGYEFGIILPGESKDGGVPVPKKTIIEPPKRTVDIEMPVYHEKSTSNTNHAPTPQFKPKKFVPGGKWEPTSESEMSEYEGEAKRSNNITGSRWDPSSCSPASLSPSFPSTSPAFNNTFAGGKGAETPPSCPSTPGATRIVLQPGQVRAPMFITPLRDIAVVAGQPAKFECIIQSEPPANILWSKNGRIIENSNDYQIHYRNGVCRLTISQTYPEDAGTYSCTASNPAGTANTIATLQVPGERRSQYIK